MKAFYKSFTTVKIKPIIVCLAAFAMQQVHAQSPGQALELNVTNSPQYATMTMGNNILQAEYTVEAWIRPTSNANVQTIFVVQEPIGANITGFGMGLQSNNISVSVPDFDGANYSTVAQLTIPFNYVVGHWYHLACIVSASNKFIKFYINGVQVYSQAQTFNSTRLFDDKHTVGNIGYNPWAVNSYFSGDIDELRIYNSSSINPATDAVSSSVNGANAYYQFDNSTASTGLSATGAVLYGPNGLPGYVQSYAMYLINANAATSVLPNSFTANWVANTSSNITNYYVDVATDADFYNIVVAKQSVSPNSKASAVITGLSANTQYYYRVRPNNTAAALEGQGAFSNTVAVKTPVNLPTLYVDAANGNDSYAGTSWGAAFATLGYALQIANSNYSVKNILIAKGTYYPAGTAAATTNNGDTAFPILRNGIRLYGGFNAATGLRNTVANPTYLDGNNSSYHVVVVAGIGAGDSVIVDGVTIRNAKCNGNTSHTYNGNGFNGNEGGGVSAVGNSGLGNKLMFRNCAFLNNTGNNHAAALYSNASSPAFVNCLFANNSDAGSGGTVFNYNGSNPVFTNCTIAYNVCAGGATIASAGSSTPVFNNSIVWLNGTTTGGNNSGISSDASPVATGSNNIIQGGLGANSTADPLFVSPAAGNFTFPAGSPAANAGSNALYTGNISTDLDLNGGQRLAGSAIDMGCYEIEPNTLDKAGLTNATAAAVAYSLRLLSSSYSGSAIKVRRSSDNATQNIGFTGNGDLDTAALKTFVGGGTGYIAAWYDQTGNGYTMSQANTSLQPYIVLNGVVQRLNNQPAIYFATSNLATTQAVIFTVGASMVGVAKGNSATPSGMVTKTGTAALTNLAYPGPFDFSNTLGSFTVGNASTQVFNGIGLNATTPVGVISNQVPASVYSFVIPATGTYSTYLNGTQTGTQTVSAFADNGNALMLGNRASGGDAGNLWLPEIILFNTALPDASRQIVEASQISYYLPPAITSFSPGSGRFGQTITIKGHFFSGATTVTFGGTAATAFTVVSDSVIIATLGEGSTGNVLVTTPAGTAAKGGFTATSTAPNSISYPSPAIFVKGINSSGVTPAQAAAGTKTQVSANFNNPDGLATDATGNLYVADHNAHTVYKVSATNGAVTTLASGFTSPLNIAADTAGNVYINDYGALKKITPGGVVTTVVQVSGLNAIATDVQGNVYVTTDRDVEKVQPSNGAVTVLWSSPSAACNGIAVDGVGNIYFTYNTGNRAYCLMKKIAPDGTVSNANSQDYVYADALAIDRTGNIYISEDYDEGDIKVVTPAGVQSVFVNSGINGSSFLQYCSSIAADVNGNIYYIDGSVSGVIKIAGPGGVITNYSIQPALPAGLSLNTTTGQVGGTAQAVSATQTYTVTASNNGGSTVASLQLAVTEVAPGDFVYAGPAAPFAVGRAITAYAPNFVAAGTQADLHLFNKPTGEAADNNYVYVITDGGVNVQKWSRLDGSVSTIATGFNNAVALAADGKGNVYVADRNNNSVSRITANNTVTVIASGLQSPNGLASDSAGNIYIAELGRIGPIQVINATGNITTVGPAVAGILSIAINPVTQEIYMGNSGSEIIKEPAGGGNTTFVSNTYPPYWSPHSALALAFDRVGNLDILLTDYTTTQLTSNGVILTYPFGYLYTVSITSDPSNNIYSTDNKYTNKLTKITGTGGAVLKYTISPSLPAGLTINSATGIISGTPAVASATQSYLITASNNAGYNTTTISLGAQNTAATAMYVDSANGNDNNNGSSWAQAYKTLSYALSVAASGSVKDSILIAKGTYYPAGTAAATTTNGDSAFIISNNGIKLYGGYNAATGTRNAAVNKTYLDGNNSSYHILAVAGIGAGDSVIVDGVTVRNANCNGITSHIYNGNGFNGNEGGAVSAINNNGLGSKLLFRNCVFTNNTGNNHAAAIYNNASSPAFVNCLFANNSGPNSGGIIFNYNSSNPVFTNCTLAYNVCSGGSVIASAGSSTPVLNNSIVWLNGTIAGNNNSGITSDATPVATGSNSIIQGGVGGNSTADPLFTNAAAGDYRLSASSPAINSGDISKYSGNINNDVSLDGTARLIGTGIDMGAYEALSNIYINDAAGNDANNGSTWSTAFKTLAYALGVANNNTSVKNIYIAAGTYYPAGTSVATAANPDSAFAITRNGLRLYGGYNAVTGARDINVSKTYLDGNNSSYHILAIAGIGAGDSVIIDGITIQRALVTGGGAGHTYNGITFNRDEGAGVAIRSNSGLGSKLLFRNCAFVNNTTTNNGAAVYNSQSSPVFVSCLFANNSGKSGTMFCYDHCYPRLVNCTFANNVATGSSAAITIVGSSTPEIDNSIIWLNTTAGSTTNSALSTDGLPSDVIINNSLIQNGDIAFDPLFISPSTGNYRLSYASHAINAGSSALYVGNINSDADIDGKARLAGAKLDLGAYETSLPASTLYVDDAGGSDANDGSTWAKALKTLSTALSAAHIGTAACNIMVAKGAYYPAGDANTTAANRDTSFAIMHNGIRLYGSYDAATGLRNPAVNKTYLDGNSSSYHIMVISGIGAGDSVIVDGVTFRNANARANGPLHIYNGTGFNSNEGGAVAAKNNSGLGNKLLFRNCIFTGNTSDNDGGAFYDAETSPYFINCLFANNTATVNGGAMFNYDGSNPVFTNCTIAYNVSAKGAAIDNYGNCTPVLNNSIVWLNGTSAGSNNSSITSNGSTAFNSNSSIIEGGAGAVDPQFVNAAGSDFRLSWHSPAVDKGNNILYTGNVNTDADINGNARLVNNVIDMGAYENTGALQWTGTTSTAWNTAANWSNGTVPVITDSVVIPSAGVTNEPAISSNVSVGGITVQAGRTLTVTGTGTLNIAGDLTNSGAFDASAGGITFMGTAAQSITGNIAVNNITINNPSGVTISSGTVKVYGIYTPQAGTLSSNGHL
ncbi:MAG TPA: choice-of-anchor Q domain-containing protein, partial [Chitinophagaceae bacterium]|nr:choice-of-anchor Q domain-containing protein [Chitinophagaceae bacterium]